MANYYGMARTNYFRVTDEKEFMEIVDKMVASEDTVDYWTKKINEETYYAFGSNDDILGICECDYCNDIEKKSDEDEDEDECESEYNYDKMCELLQNILHPDDAIIITSIGYEKLRYIGADSTIITKNEIKNINIWSESIKLAKEMLKNNDYDTEYSY